MSADDGWDIRAVYFEWLYAQVFTIRDLGSNDSYLTVCSHLHSIEFWDGVPNDDNRRVEGEELRDEFVSKTPVVDAEDYAELYSNGRASVFEMLIALSRRADFIIELGMPQWMQVFLENLGLLKYSDARFRVSHRAEVERIVRTFNTRQYDRTGQGGIFPLTRTRRDQRKIELWYQMAAYMKERRMY